MRLHRKMDLVFQKNHSSQEHPNYILLLAKCFKKALKKLDGGLVHQIILCSTRTNTRSPSLVLPSCNFYITLTSSAENLTTAHGQITHSARSFALPQQSQPKKHPASWLTWTRNVFQNISKQKAYLRNTSVVPSLSLPLWRISAPISHWAIVCK